MLTFGHGRLDGTRLAALLTGAGVEAVVDVRRFPGSRANPDSARGQIPVTLDGVGIDYRWDERLGGRRSLPTAERESSPDRWWRVEAFRAYAGWTRSDEFRSAVPELVADDGRQVSAIMCSEAVWWRCHRRIIADYLLACGETVFHILSEDRPEPARLTAGAVVEPDGRIIYPAPPDPSRPA